MRGGSQKVTSDDEGEGGVRIPLKNDDVIYEQPQSTTNISMMFCIICPTAWYDVSLLCIL